MDVAIIGMGSMGRRHAEALRLAGLRVAGIYDKNPEALRAAVEHGHIPPDRCFADAGEMLAVARPQCVIVATTAPSHSFYTCLAAGAGARYILCEKPMAVSLRECDQMVEVCRAREVRLAVNHQMRFMDHYREAKRIVQGTEFGGLSSVTVVAGNMGMATNGLHYFEMFRYISDERPTHVTAWLEARGAADPRGPDFEDRAGSVRVVTATGKRLYLELGADQGHGIKVIYAGRCGQLVIDELTGHMSLSVRGAPHRDLPTVRYAMPANERVLRVEPTETVRSTRRVIEALVSGEEAPSGEEGRLAVAVLVAAYASMQRGSASVSVDDPTISADTTFPWA